MHALEHKLLVHAPLQGRPCSGTNLLPCLACSPIQRSNLLTFNAPTNFELTEVTARRVHVLPDI